MITKKLIILLVVLATCQVANSQQLSMTAIDSLMLVWGDESQPDTTRLNAMHRISKEGYESSQPDSAFYFAQLQYDFAEKKELKLHMAKALNTQGTTLYNRGDYVKAVEYQTHSLEICEEIGYKKGVASSLNNIGLVNEMQGDYINAMENYLTCLEIFEEIGDKRARIGALNNIGIVYQIQGDYFKAIDYYTQGLKIAEQIDNQKVVLTLLNNIGLIYKDQSDYLRAKEYFTSSLNLAEEISYQPGIAFSLNNTGDIYEIQGDFSKAIDYYTRSLTIRESINDQQGIVSSLGKIGMIYKNQGDNEKAMDYQIRSLNIAKEIGYQQGIAFSLNNVGVIYGVLGNDNKAISYSTQALATAKKIGALLEIKAAAGNLYEVYKHKGDFKASLTMHELYIAMRDSIENVEVQKTVVRQEIEYNYQKQAVADSIAFGKQREVDALIQEAVLKKEVNQRYVLLAGFLVILIILGIYLRIRYIKIEAEKDVLLQELKLLKIDVVVKKTFSSTLKDELILDKEKIEKSIKVTLNPSDWGILTALYNNPAIGNVEIAEEVSLSVAGVRSSLQKMYRSFYIENSSNQRLILVMEATKISSGHPS